MQNLETIAQISPFFQILHLIAYTDHAYMNNLTNLRSEVCRTSCSKGGIIV